MDNTSTPGDARPEADLDPAAALALIVAQQQAVRRSIDNITGPILPMWGAIWLLGFGALWLKDGLKPAFTLSPAVAWTIFIVLMAGGVAVSIFLGIFSGRGIRTTPDSQFRGMAFGLSCFVGWVIIYGMAMIALRNGMPSSAMEVFMSSASCAMIGLTFTIAASVWLARPMLFLGLGITAVAIVAGFCGQPWNYFVLAVVGGGSMLIGGLMYRARIARGELS